MSPVTPRVRVSGLVAGGLSDGNSIVIDRIVTKSENAIIVGGSPPTMLRKYNTETHVASVLSTSVEIGPQS
jgi:hypothetical protein